MPATTVSTSFCDVSIPRPVGPLPSTPHRRRSTTHLPLARNRFSKIHASIVWAPTPAPYFCFEERLEGSGKRPSRRQHETRGANQDLVHGYRRGAAQRWMGPSCP